MRTFSLGLAAAALGCAMCLNPQTARAQIEPFIAQIATFGFNFCPNGWAPLNGQLIPINQNTALFSLLGTYYGGNGTTNFALPNLQGSAPLQQGQGQGLSIYDLGE